MKAIVVLTALLVSQFAVADVTWKLFKDLERPTNVQFGFEETHGGVRVLARYLKPGCDTSHRGESCTSYRKSKRVAGLIAEKGHVYYENENAKVYCGKLPTFWTGSKMHKDCEMKIMPKTVCTKWLVRGKDCIRGKDVFEGKLFVRTN